MLKILCENVMLENYWVRSYVWLCERNWLVFSDFCQTSGDKYLAQFKTRINCSVRFAFNS